MPPATTALVQNTGSDAPRTPAPHTAQHATARSLASTSHAPDCTCLRTTQPARVRHRNHCSTPPGVTQHHKPLTHIRRSCVQTHTRNHGFLTDTLSGHTFRCEGRRPEPHHDRFEAREPIDACKHPSGACALESAAHGDLLPQRTCGLDKSRAFGHRYCRRVLRVDGNTLTGPVTATVLANGDISWSHGYISRKEGTAPPSDKPSQPVLDAELNSVARNTDDTHRARALAEQGADLLDQRPPWHHAAPPGRLPRPLRDGQDADRAGRAARASNPWPRRHGSPLELARGGGHRHRHATRAPVAPSAAVPAISWSRSAARARRLRIWRCAAHERLFRVGNYGNDDTFLHLPQLPGARAWAPNPPQERLGSGFKSTSRRHARLWECRRKARAASMR